MGGNPKIKEFLIRRKCFTSGVGSYRKGSVVMDDSNMRLFTLRTLNGASRIMSTREFIESFMSDVIASFSGSFTTFIAVFDEPSIPIGIKLDTQKKRSNASFQSSMRAKLKAAQEQGIVIGDAEEEKIRDEVKSERTMFRDTPDYIVEINEHGFSKRCTSTGDVVDQGPINLDLITVDREARTKLVTYLAKNIRHGNIPPGCRVIIDASAGRPEVIDHDGYNEAAAAALPLRVFSEADTQMIEHAKRYPGKDVVIVSGDTDQIAIQQAFYLRREIANRQYRKQLSANTKAYLEDHPALGRKKQRSPNGKRTRRVVLPQEAVAEIEARTLASNPDFKFVDSFPRLFWQWKDRSEKTYMHVDSYKFFTSGMPVDEDTCQQWTSAQLFIYFIVMGCDFYDKNTVLYFLKANVIQAAILNSESLCDYLVSNVCENPSKVRKAFELLVCRIWMAEMKAKMKNYSVDAAGTSAVVIEEIEAFATKRKSYHGRAGKYADKATWQPYIPTKERLGVAAGRFYNTAAYWITGRLAPANLTH